MESHDQHSSNLSPVTGLLTIIEGFPFVLLSPRCIHVTSSSKLLLSSFLEISISLGRNLTIHRSSHFTNVSGD